MRLRYFAISSIAMPLATRVPTNGGGNSGLSSVTVRGASRQPVGRGRRGVARPARHPALGDLAPERVVGLAARLELDEPVHHPEPLEGVLAVEDAPVVVLAELALHVGPGQRRAPEEHGHLGVAEVAHHREVLAHDQRRLHEQPAHPERVGLVLLDRGEHLVDPDLDPEVDDVVAVVREDDVDEVLADVVDVALHRREHDGALAPASRTAPCAARGTTRPASSSRRSAARRGAASPRSRTGRRRRASPPRGGRSRS